jgi:hypothetical protein
MAFEKLIVVQLLEKTIAFMAPESELPCSQLLATGPCSEPN